MATAACYARFSFIASLVAAASSGASAFTSDELASRRIAAIEFVGRARPEAAAISAQTLVDELPFDAPERIDALALRGKLLVDAQDPAGARAVVVQLEAIAEHADQPPFESRLALSSARLVSAALIQAQSLPRSDALLEAALEALPTNAPASMWMRVASLLARSKERLGKFDDAVALNLRAISRADDQGPAWRRADLRSALGYELFTSGHVDRARTTIQESLEIAHEHDDPLSLCLALNTRSYLWESANDFPRQLADMKEAVADAQRAGARREEGHSLANLGDVYLLRGDYLAAIDASQRSISLSRSTGNKLGESIALVNLGYALIETGHRTEGMRRVNEALSMSEQIGNQDIATSMFEELGGHLEHVGDLKDAYIAYRRFLEKASDDSRRKQQAAIAELEAHFDDQQRAHQISLLKREGDLQRENLANHELAVRWWGLLAAGGLTILTVFVVGLVWLRRANRALRAGNSSIMVEGETDVLTGLSNRRRFHHLTASDACANGVLLIADIDHFKQVNDRFGHAEGDRALIAVAQRLRMAFRAPDVVLRWGGEEFLVLLSMRPGADLDELAARLRQAVSGNPVELAGSQQLLTVSAGIVALEPCSTCVSWEAALAMADEALYRAKAAGRDRSITVRWQGKSSEPKLDAVEEGVAPGGDALQRCMGSDAPQRVAEGDI